MLTYTTDGEQCHDSLAQIARKLQQIGEQVADASRQLAATTETLESLSQNHPVPDGLESGVNKRETAETATDQPFDLQWNGLLSTALVHDRDVAAHSRQLFQSACNGEQPALALLAKLMMFRAACGEEQLPLLREIGECYYRWADRFGCEPEPWRNTLILWLVEECARTGVAPTIELAHIGDRFDRNRHQASNAGTEITGISGWIVLRGNGSVYTKAAVTL